MGSLFLLRLRWRVAGSVASEEIGIGEEAKQYTFAQQPIARRACAGHCATEHVPTGVEAPDWGSATSQSRSGSGTQQSAVCH
jgi:hypothetical protein